MSLPASNSDVWLPGLEVEMKPPDNLALKSSKTFLKLFMNSDQLYVMQLTRDIALTSFLPLLTSGI